MESKGIHFTPATVRRKIADNVYIYIYVYIVHTNAVNRNKRR